MLNHIDFSSHKHQGTEQCRRLFHGRGGVYKGFEHVVIDWLPPVALITLYKEDDPAWIRETAEALFKHLPDCQSVQVQYRCRPKAPTELLLGDEIQDLVADENGLKFHIQLGRAQNTGLFLDMRNGRDWVRKNASGKRVLNLFAYTCPFSVAAIAGDASHVVNMDMAKSALSKGRENHRLNNQDTSKVTFQGVDIFKSFSRIKKLGPYDLLICDPPEFQKGSVDIKRDYKKIIRRIPEFMNPGAQLMLCLNSPSLTESFIYDMVAEECPACTFIETIAPPEVYVDIDPRLGLKVLIFTLGNL